ncbi:MAG: hypothetical protein K6G64_04890 [Eubacterium sp.]|nr:hypothetical protein [Eubacterium sp.]
MKKLLTILLMITILVISPYELVKADGGEVASDDEISLRYTNLSLISAGLTINSSGLAVCTGTVTMKKNYDSRLYIHLYKSSSSGAYTKIKSWAQSFSGTGVKSLTKSTNVSKGYTYKIKVEVRIYNSAGTVIETAEKWSSNVVYN